jgi:hypothetical protein
VTAEHDLEDALLSREWKSFHYVKQLIASYKTEVLSDAVARIRLAEERWDDELLSGGLIEAAELIDPEGHV